MKAKFFKIVVPTFAILLAVAVSAFSVLDESNTGENVPIIAYIATGNTSAPCDEVQVECREVGAMDCVYGMEKDPVYRDEGDTLCSFVLSKIPQ